MREYPLLKHGLIITMCGNTQKEFKHGIEKTDHSVVPRISLSFRQVDETLEKNIICT